MVFDRQDSRNHYSRKCRRCGSRVRLSYWRRSIFDRGIYNFSKSFYVHAFSSVAGNEPYFQHQNDVEECLLCSCSHFHPIGLFYSPHPVWTVLNWIIQAMNPFRTGKLVLFQVTYDRDWHFFEIIFFVILGIFGVSKASFGLMLSINDSCRDFMVRSW